MERVRLSVHDSCDRSEEVLLNDSYVRVKNKCSCVIGSSIRPHVFVCADGVVGSEKSARGRREEETTPAY